MINPVAMQHFFQMLEILTNPERSKAELETFQKALDSIQKENERLEVIRADIRSNLNKIDEADQIIKREEMVREALARQQDELDKAKNALATRLADLSGREASLASDREALNSATETFNRASKALGAREEEVGKREVVLTERKNALASEKKEHQERVAQLRALV